MLKHKNKIKYQYIDVQNKKIILKSIGFILKFVTTDIIYLGTSVTQIILIY